MKIVLQIKPWNNILPLPYSSLELFIKVIKKCKFSNLSRHQPWSSFIRRVTVLCGILSHILSYVPRHRHRWSCTFICHFTPSMPISPFRLRLTSVCGPCDRWPRFWGILTLFLSLLCDVLTFWLPNAWSLCKRNKYFCESKFR